MSSDYDIEMTTDDTLELDAIIDSWDPKSNSVITEDQKAGSYNMNGFQTKTAVFDPDDSGVYKFDINGQIISIKVIDEIFNSTIESFEDNDININNPDWSGWSGNTSNLTVQSSTVIKGKYSGEFTESGKSSIYSTRDSNIEADGIRISFITPSNGSTGQNNDRLPRIEFGNTNKDLFSRVSFNGDGVITEVESGTYLQSWSSGTQYDIELKNIDWSSETYDIVINETNHGQFDFGTSVNGFGFLNLFTNTNWSGTTRTYYFDQWELYN